MGIKQLSALLKKAAAHTLSDWKPVKGYTGQTLAIDASPCLYQCLTVSDCPGDDSDTSHIEGFLRRTVKLLELGIKPIFVFDGEAPDLKKSGALTKREQLRAKSREQLQEAVAAGDDSAVRRYSARLVKITQKHNDDVMEVLQLMGVPAVQAPSEAECLCCALVASGRADAVATEDFDALAFGACRQVRFLHQGATSSGGVVQEVKLDNVLSSLGYSHAEFVDLCILAGCDYLDTIPRIGIHTAHQLLTKHRSLEAVLESLDPKKHVVPEGWDFQAVRAWFREPLVGDVKALRLEPRRADVGKLRELLARHGLRPAMVDGYLDRLAAVNGPAPPDEVVTTPVRGPTQRLVSTPARSARTGSQVPKGPAKGSPPKGQPTLLGFLAGKRAADASTSELETALKRRRTAAIDALTVRLGPGVDMSGADVDHLERLVADLAADDLASGALPADLVADGSKGILNSGEQGKLVFEID